MVFAAKIVAPYVGAWIETCKLYNYLSQESVAPYVGAWIETASEILADNGLVGRTLRGCVD